MKSPPSSLRAAKSPYSRWALSFLLTVTSCSIFNRVGPDASCSALQGGKVNACRDGIIASCRADKLNYVACDDSAACEASWQVPGAFRCRQSDPANCPDSAELNCSDKCVNLNIDSM